MIIETKQKNQSVGAFFKSLGIKDCKTKKDFWKHVTKVDTLLADELEPLICRKKEGNLYEVKNLTLPFSLAVESWTMSFHKSLMSWITKQKQLKPKRILEIGCDNGFLACWYAAQFPDAEVTGIDQSTNGIVCAQELAKKQGLGNVNFHQMTVWELTEHFSINSFDLIISVRTFHEIMGPVYISKYWSLPEYLMENHMYRDNGFLHILDSLLAEKGTFLSCERLENPGDVGKWANSLKEANLHIQWECSDIIDYHDFGTKKRSPILLATKSETGISTLKGMEHLYTKGQPLELHAGKYYSGAQAEFAFHHCGGKRFHSGMYLDMANHWDMFRFEIWESNAFLLVYSSGNMGHRHLDILPAGAYGDAQLLLEEAMGQFSHLGPIVRYGSLNDRPV